MNKDDEINNNGTKVIQDEQQDVNIKQQDGQAQNQGDTNNSLPK